MWNFHSHCSGILKNLAPKLYKYPKYEGLKKAGTSMNTRGQKGLVRSTSTSKVRFSEHWLTGSLAVGRCVTRHKIIEAEKEFHFYVFLGLILTSVRFVANKMITDFE